MRQTKKSDLKSFISSVLNGLKYHLMQNHVIAATSPPSM